MPKITGWSETSRIGKRYRKWIMQMDGRTVGRAFIQPLKNSWMAVIKFSGKIMNQVFDTFIEALSWIRKQMKLVSLEVFKL